MMRLCASTSILPGARIFGRHQYSPLWRHLAPSLDQSALCLKLRIFRIRKNADRYIYQHFFCCVKKHEMNFLLFLYTIKFLIIDKSFGCETNLQTSALRLLSGGIFCTGGRLKRYALWCIERSGKDSSMHE